MNYSELLQLAKGWSNFVSNRINICRLLSTDYLIFGKDIETELESIARIVGNDKIKLTKIKTIAEVVYGE